ncbi:MAG: HAMP domain-containing histidine kinase [Leptolinea sp.]|jgi:signal transduction histidine kinase|nr:HAMP domain-containing histidine kinase [Leptolinea sp.]
MRSLRFRLIFNNLLPVLIILPLVGILIIYLLETQGVVASVSRDLNQQAILVADTAGLQDDIWVDRKSAQTFLSRISPRLSARVMLLDTGGRMLVSSDPADEGLIGKILFRGQYQSAEELERKAAKTPPETDEVVVPVVRPDGLLLGFVRMDNPLSTIYQQSLQLRQVTIWVVVVGVFLGILLGWLLSRDLSTQLQTATQAVTRLATGQSLDLLDDAKKPQEIARLYQAFNTLTTRLKNLEENRKRLLANLVHEIGRPLGSLQSAVQALSGGAVKDRELRTDLLEGMSGELHRLDHLVGELANLHNELAGTLTLNREPVAVGEWLQKITEIYGQEAKNKGLQWECLIPSDLPVVNLDADQLTLAVQNLISNAIRYTPAGEKVSVLCGISEDELIISVMDTGPGIAVEEQQRIFEPFTRGSSARRFSQGMGLGLTIAREMIEAHGGRIELISDIGKGSEFRLILPVKKT